MTFCLGVFDVTLGCLRRPTAKLIRIHRIQLLFDLELFTTAPGFKETFESSLLIFHFFRHKGFALRFFFRARGCLV